MKLLFVILCYFCPFSANVWIHWNVWITRLCKVCPHCCELERHQNILVVQGVGCVVERVPEKVEFITVSYSWTIVMIQTWSCYSVIFTLYLIKYCSTISFFLTYLVRESVLKGSSSRVFKMLLQKIVITKYKEGVSEHISYIPEVVRTQVFYSNIINVMVEDLC